MGAPPFSAPCNADVILVSRDDASLSGFHVHKCILAAASSFFHDMFSLPQSPSETKCPIIPMTESRSVIHALLQFIYPVEEPAITSLDELVPILAAAVKYDLTSVIASLGKILVSPRFIKTEPTRVYAIASRFELEEEAKIASRHTLNVNVIEVPLSEDLKHITAFSYIRLLALHRRRVNAALALLRLPPDVKCVQCNGSAHSVYIAPKWWIEFERMAREELSVRPTTDVIFKMEFLFQAASASGCTRCASSILESWKSLEDLKQKIDGLPSTI